VSRVGVGVGTVVGLLVRVGVGRRVGARVGVDVRVWVGPGVSVGGSGTVVGTIDSVGVAVANVVFVAGAVEDGSGLGVSDAVGDTVGDAVGGAAVGANAMNEVETDAPAIAQNTQPRHAMTAAARLITVRLPGPGISKEPLGMLLVSLR
jgi:hypothetical protein